MDSNQGVCGSEEVVQATPVSIAMTILRGSISCIENGVQVLSEKLLGVMSEPCPRDGNEKQPAQPDITCEASRQLRESSERVTVVASLLQDMIDRCQL